VVILGLGFGYVGRLLALSPATTLSMSDRHPNTGLLFCRVGKQKICYVRDGRE
jgi:hypothetical protein